MNAMRNKVMLIGNVGNDPQIIELEGGRKLAKFSIATNENYKNSKGERIQKTQWHKIVLWGNLAGIAENFVSKGKEVAIEGRLEHRSYEDKEGNTHYITEVVASEMLLLGSKAS